MRPKERPQINLYSFDKLTQNASYHEDVRFLLALGGPECTYIVLEDDEEGLILYSLYEDAISTEKENLEPGQMISINQPTYHYLVQVTG